MEKMNRPKIGLALGSGGARGLAHIGVIKVLEENNIPIDFIAGSSIGAMIGGFYAAGVNINIIEKIALSTNWREIFSMIDPHLGQGLMGGKKVKTFIEDYIGKKEFKDCKIPFVAVATDLKTGEIITLDKNEMAIAIRASISIPLVFKPVEIENRMLVDGGISAPVPVDIVKNMGADIVIAINLDKHYYNEKFKTGWYDTANDTLNILRHHLARLNTINADLIIDMDVSKSYWYEFVDGQNKISIGEQTMKELLPKLKEIIQQKTK